MTTETKATAELTTDDLPRLRAELAAKEQEAHAHDQVADDKQEQLDRVTADDSLTPDQLIARAESLEQDIDKERGRARRLRQHIADWTTANRIPELERELADRENAKATADAQARNQAAMDAVLAELRGRGNRLLEIYVELAATLDRVTELELTTIPALTRMGARMPWDTSEYRAVAKAAEDRAREIVLPGRRHGTLKQHLAPLTNKEA